MENDLKKGERGGVQVVTKSPTKSKLLNTSLVNNVGARVQPHVLIGSYRGFTSGDILDANAVAMMMESGGGSIDPESMAAALALKVSKVGDTMTGPLNFNSNNAIKISGTDAVAFAGGKMSFGNITNPTQIRSNDHIQVTTRDNVWTVWDSGNLDPTQFATEEQVSKIETNIEDINQNIEDNELVISSALNDLNSRIIALTNRVAALENQ